MYFGFFGGSALLHLLAAHPKVVAAVGIATTVTLLATSMGPQNYLGAGQQIRRLERIVAANELVDAGAMEDVAAAAQRMANMPLAEIEQTVRRVLRECGNGCADLTPAIVMNDTALLQNALYISELDRHATEERPMTRDRIAQLLTRR